MKQTLVQWTKTDEEIILPNTVFGVFTQADVDEIKQDPSKDYVIVNGSLEPVIKPGFDSKLVVNTKTREAYFEYTKTVEKAPEVSQEEFAAITESVDNAMIAIIELYETIIGGGN